MVRKGYGLCRGCAESVYNILIELGYTVKPPFFENEQWHVEYSLSESTVIDKMDLANYHGCCDTCGVANKDMLTDTYCAACEVRRLGMLLQSTSEFAAGFDAEEGESGGR